MRPHFLGLYKAVFISVVEYECLERGLASSVSRKLLDPLWRNFACIYREVVYFV